MRDAGFIIGSYAVTLGAVAAFALNVVRRGRRLAARVPQDDMPWT